MDHNTSIHDLKKRVGDFCDQRGWDRYHNAKDLAIGVITEASELLEHFRFRSEKEVEELLKNPQTRRKICEELADVLHTILRFAQKYDIDLTTVLSQKMRKNRKKYPLRKSAKGKWKR